jgi:hypothetical protein
MNLLKNLEWGYQCINYKVIRNRKKEWQFILPFVKRNMGYSFLLILHQED